MSTIGIPGIILLLILALLLFGPNKLPELGRAFGRTLKEFKAGASDIMGDDNSSSSSRKEVHATESASAPVVTQIPQQAQANETSRRLPE
ncbi:twin-arginine translocase TatA/TatE family subunit [Paenibacillus marinisediminis]